MTQGPWWRASSWRKGGSSRSSPPTPDSRSGDARVPEDELRKPSSEIWRYKELSFSFSSPHQATILAVPCPVAAARCPFQVTSSNTVKPTSVTPSPSVNFNIVTVVLRLRLRLRLFCSFNAASLPNFNKMVRRELLITGVQQLEDVFSILRTNFRAWINTSDIEEQDLSAERRKSGRLLYSGESAGLRWPPSPYQFSRCILFFSVSDSSSTAIIRSTVGAKVMGMRTVHFCTIKITRINHKPMDSRTIINLLSSAMWETKRMHTHTHTHTGARARARKKKREMNNYSFVCVYVYTFKTFHIGTDRIQ